MKLIKLIALLSLVGCASHRLHDDVSNLHFEKDTGCGGGYVATVCQRQSCWTGDVSDLVRK